VSDSVAWFPEPFYLPGSSKEEQILAAFEDFAVSKSTSAKPAAVKALYDTVAMYDPAGAAILFPAFADSAPEERVDDSRTEERVPVQAAEQVPTMQAEERVGNDYSNSPDLPVQPPVVNPSSIFSHPVITAASYLNIVPQSSTDRWLAQHYEQPTRQSLRLAHNQFPPSASSISAVTDEMIAALNLHTDNTKLSVKKGLAGPNSLIWMSKLVFEWKKHFDQGIMFPILPSAIPKERLGDITYINPVTKEKIGQSGEILRRIRLTAGGDRTNFDGQSSSRSSDMAVFKTFVQSVASDRANGIPTTVTLYDAADFYIGAVLPEDRPEFVKVPVSHVPDSVIKEYNLEPFIVNGFIYFKIVKCLWGLPQSGYISQCKLFKLLEENGYHEDLVIPCLFTNKAKSLSLLVTVDDFLVKSSDPAASSHLKQVLDSQYKIKTDTGERGYYTYLGFKIEFDNKAKLVSLSMPHYWDHALQILDPDNKIRSASTPAVYHPVVYGSRAAQLPIQPDVSPPLTPDELKRVQVIVGIALYYARAIDHSFLTATNYVASLQSQPTKLVQAAAERIVAYAKHNPTAVLQLHACDMQHHCQTDASLNSRPNGTSVAGDYHFFGNYDDPDTLNGPIACHSTPVPTVCISTGEVEYAAGSMCAHNGIYYRHIAEALGYPQRTSSLVCDNEVAVGIASESIKLHRTKGLDMRYHSLRQLTRDGIYKPVWRKGANNVADFMTKFLPFSAHQTKLPLLLGHRDQAEVFFAYAQDCCAF
jgi:hypothetical protein